MQTLFDLIFEFFSSYVFTQQDYSFLNDTYFKCGYIFDYSTDQFSVNYITQMDWLNTTATIISITIIVVLCCLFVYKIIRLIGGLIR